MIETEFFLRDWDAKNKNYTINTIAFGRIQNALADKTKQVNVINSVELESRPYTFRDEWTIYASRLWEQKKAFQRPLQTRYSGNIIIPELSEGQVLGVGWLRYSSNLAERTNSLLLEFKVGKRYIPFEVYDNQVLNKDTKISDLLIVIND